MWIPWIYLFFLILFIEEGEKKVVVSKWGSGRCFAKNKLSDPTAFIICNWKASIHILVNNPVHGMAWGPTKWDPRKFEQTKSNNGLQNILFTSITKWKTNSNCVLIWLIFYYYLKMTSSCIGFKNIGYECINPTIFASLHK